MPLPLNYNAPTIMHVDLNCCFATIEQQANPLLRGKPIVVAAYNSPNGCVVAPSIEAKRYGIKTGMTVRDAKLLYPPVIVKTPDPAKYRAVHLLFRRIFRDYSPDVTPKSIDEAVIDLTDTLCLYKGTILDLGREIKKRFRTEIGEWMSGLDHMKVYTGGKKFLPTFSNRSMPVKSMAKANHPPKYGECLSL